MPVVPEYHMKGTKAMRNHVVTKTVMFALVALAGVSVSGFLLPGQQQSDQFARAGSQTCPHDDSGLTLPTGFCATVFVDGIGHARHMVVAANGVLYVNTWSGRYYGDDTPHAGGFLVALQDKNGAGKANVIERFGETVQTGGHGGTGIGVYKGAIYAEINDRIVRYSLSANSIVSSGHGETIVSGLPLGGDHPMHPFIISANGTMYIDVATPTNSCQVKNRMLESPGLNPFPELETRGGIWRYDANKTNQPFSPAERYATGIRNAEGFAPEPNGQILSRWKSEEHENGSICKIAADASKPEVFLAGVEIAKSLQQTGRFCIPFRKTARQQAVRSSFSVKEEDSACIQTDRNHGCGLAHVSTFGRNHAGGDGRTSTHHPRLLAAQQPSCHEQVSAGHVEDQTFGAGQIGRRYFADGYFSEDNPNSMSAVWNRFRMRPVSFGAYRPLTSPD